VPGPTLPPVPQYGAGAAPSGSTTSTYDPNDIWQLGQLYNVPIYLGYSVGPTKEESALDRHLPGSDRPSRGPDGPQYKDAEDVVSGYYNQWVKGTAGNDSQAYQAFVNLQKSLYYSGAYGQTSFDKIHAGQWTSQTVNALSEALNEYHQASQSGAPISFEEWLSANAKGAQKAGGGFYSDTTGSGASAPVLNLADPQTLRMTAQQAAQAALGRNLSSDELSRFVDSFHAQQQAAFGAANAQGATSYTDAGSPTAAAEAFVAQGHGQEAGQHQVIGYADALLNHLMSGSGELPTGTVDPTVTSA
jgi:hypothetical protein